MKGSRDFRVSKTQKEKRKSMQSGDVEDPNGSTTSKLSDLPMAILIDILVRLPMIAILTCRCVSKTWRGIISDPDFAKLQFQNSHLHLMLRTNDKKHVSRSLLLVEIEPHSFGPRPFNCGTSGEVSHLLNRQIKINLYAKFNIPLRDAKMVLDDMLQAGTQKLKVNSKRKRKPSITARPTFDKVGVVNSCNGLLCLSEPKKHIPIAVCNPITGEFIKLLNPPRFEKSIRPFVNSGLGFCKNNNQYKVVRIYTKYDRHFGYVDITDVFTLGKAARKAMGQLRDVISHTCFCILEYPTYLKGQIHWLHELTSSIVSFDFETELFQRLMLPNELPSGHRQFVDYLSMGVLSGSLCICKHNYLKHVDIWVVEGNGDQVSWINMYHIEFNSGYWLLPYPYQIIKVYENGAVLMFHPQDHLVYAYHDPKLEFPEFRFFKIRGSEPKFEAFTHVPSLISLKDALAGNEVEVLNLNSRCGQFRLREENLSFCLEEVDIEEDSDSEA